MRRHCVVGIIICFVATVSSPIFVAISEQDTDVPISAGTWVSGSSELEAEGSVKAPSVIREVVNSEEALYQEIQTVSNFWPEPLPENATEAERAARREQYQQNWERGLQLCEQFLNTYSESDQYDEVLYKKLI